MKAAIITLLMLVGITGFSLVVVHKKLNDIEPEIPIEKPISPDKMHQWELIGESKDCSVWYRKHLHVRIYWTICKNGNSSVSVE